MIRERRLRIAAFLLTCLPLCCSLVESASSSSRLISNNDNVRLVFDVDDSNHCRVHLQATNPTSPASVAAVNPIPFKKNQKRHVSKKTLVLEYEEKVERMHLIKRAQPLLSDQLDVIFHDESMVVVHKPAGFLCVPDINKNPSLLDLVWTQYGKPEEVSDQEYGNNASSMIVNRLDMDTSGLVVFGRTASATRALNQAFRERHVLKEYEALVCGHIRFDSGLIDLPLQRDHEHPPFMRVSTPKSEEAAAALIDELIQSGYKKQGRKKPKPSQTTFRVVERFYHPCDSSIPITRLRLQPMTGRTHQLRVHCAAMGHPIVGDPTYGLYGDAAMYGGLEDAVLTPIPECESTGLHRASLELQTALAQVHPPNVKPMCLHAALLRMSHPATGDMVEWTAPVPF
ncbi:RNA pseudouridylate synthase [Fragilaria crotonensis]|nr:RNA pseudouridylate synthase [Fragilaria crotonensis]